MAERKPVFVMDEDVERTKGKDAQSNNIEAAKAVGETIKTTLGPSGMDKMLVNSTGNVIVTNDGSTILGEMDIDHPAAKMIVEVSETQDEEVGDGTTTAVLLTSKLLSKAEDMLDQDIHPTIIAEGYREAEEKSMEILDEMKQDITIADDKEILRNVAKTAMTGKGVIGDKDILAKTAVDAVTYVTKETEDGYNAKLDNIKMETKTGANISDTQLIEGMVIDKDKPHPEMPDKIENTKIAVLDTEIEVGETETDAEVTIDSPGQRQKFLEREEKQLKEKVEKINETGANVVFCEEAIDDVAQQYLVNKGIHALKRVDESDINKIAKATGASVVSNINELTEDDLGEAETVREEALAGDKVTYIEGCKELKALTVLLRGGTEQLVEEAERTLDDAIDVVATAINDGDTIAGGGAPEAELSLKLRDYAATIGGREQIAIEAFADALESIPLTLAENAGLDPMDTLVNLKKQHEEDNQNAGIDGYEEKITDMTEKGVLEPIKIKKQAMKSATEATEMVLRIDDVLSSKTTE
ncbi:MAG: Chaperonin GroEL HSP60 family [Candidatus Methanohalarchaeum thermophilum]|uniref:Chaperonin GroEL HSP60 family n=1 Tax=Methanohalarchaeum thermophilum TaxID=1903181 RepID=A0A1Q6DSW7_METT1|nr:MAG: Chaperonin GroEL HSP60 family [Candidatus Methanohalarchaeum thermophilum]